MTSTLVTVLRDKEIRRRLLVTLGLLFCYRVGFFVPLPGVDIQEMNRQQELGGGFAGLFNALKRLCASCSQSEKEAIFAGTARRVYRLDC